MNNLFLSTAGSMAALLLLGSCTTTPPEAIPIEERMANQGYTIGEQVKRIRDYRINGWNSVDRYNVIMHVGVSNHYLVTVRAPCEGLLSAATLTFSTTTGVLTDKDKLVVRGGGRYLERCPIDTIHILEKSGQDHE